MSVFFHLSIIMHVNVFSLLRLVFQLLGRRLQDLLVVDVSRVLV